MPELAEVETVRRTVSNALQGKRIVSAEFPADSIVHSKLPPEALLEAVVGARVEAVGRKGKYWWIEFDRKPWLFSHLGMAGWVRELGEPTIRLKEHGKAPLDDENGRPRFLKMLLTAEDGRRIALTDGRRLARIWLAENPLANRNIKQLGPDVFLEPREVDSLHAILAKRDAPIKALLLDQGLFAGVGNWIADEVLYAAGIAPSRPGQSLSREEVGRLLDAIRDIVTLAVDTGADEAKYPEGWLFHKRWGGKRGADEIDGQAIRRETIGGRTTAWVPSRQF